MSTQKTQSINEILSLIKIEKAYPFEDKELDETLYKDTMNDLFYNAIKYGKLPEGYESSFEFQVWYNGHDNIVGVAHKYKARGSYIYFSEEKKDGKSVNEKIFINEDIHIALFPKKFGKIDSISLSIYSTNPILRCDNSTDKVEISITITDSNGWYSKDLSRKFLMDRQDFDNLAKRHREGISYLM